MQLPFGRFLYGDLSPMAQTRFGDAFVTMTLVFALVLALVYLSWLLDRVEPLVPAFALAVVFVGGLSVSGHDAVDPGSSWKTEIADWLHLSAASLWIGALATMALLLWTGAPELRRAAFMRFSRLATVLIAVVLGAGVYLAIVRLPQRQRPVDDRLRARAAREDRARLASRSSGARSTTSSSRRRSNAPTRASSGGSAAASPARAWSGWPSCCWRRSSSTRGRPT